MYSGDKTSLSEGPCLLPVLRWLNGSGEADLVASLVFLRLLVALIEAFEWDEMSGSCEVKSKSLVAVFGACETDEMSASSDVMVC